MKKYHFSGIACRSPPVHQHTETLSKLVQNLPRPEKQSTGRIIYQCVTRAGILRRQSRFRDISCFFTVGKPQPKAALRLRRRKTLVFESDGRSARKRSIKSVQNLPRPEKQSTGLFFTPQAGSGFRFPHGEYTSKQSRHPKSQRTEMLNQIGAESPTP